MKAETPRAALLKWVLCGLLALAALGAQAADKVALLSTRFVLERKFELMQEAARQQGLELAWTQVDREGEAGVRRALDGARLVIIDAPRSDDIGRVEQVAGKLLREAALPGAQISVMQPPLRLKPLQLPREQAQRLFDYYVGGTAANHERLAHYLKALLRGEPTETLPPPRELPNGGIYHPAAPPTVFTRLDDYLAWWQAHRAAGRDWRALPVLAMEMSSSYIADGQTRMLDETVAAIEQAGAVPLVFYRSTRVARARGAAAGGPRAAAADEALLTHEGRLLPQVLMVNTFLGADPEGRKAWHQAMGIPVINVVNYRGGTRADYAKDPAGISSFNLPFTLTTAEYIGLQDPVVLAANEGGEMRPMPEQMQLLVGKALSLARLALLPNADKRLALLIWNHPPGEKNQGASHLNVPRSIAQLLPRLREAGYAVDAASEQAIIDAVAQMLRPSYRRDSLPELMKQRALWDFLPLAHYRRWYATLPAEVRAGVDKRWGAPERSPWVARVDGRSGFVIPRLKLGQLVVLPQPQRGELAGADEQQMFHDTQLPLNHFYLATYLWIREQQGAHAIIHFGTHGTQEWTPGKERGLWAYDQPNLLVGNVPVVYPYIVDNIGEALHAKRRGRALIVSHQTPPFGPAGLSDDFVRINDLIREYTQLDEGLVKDNARKLIIEQAVRMNVHQDMKWKVADLEREFPRFLRDIEDYLEQLGAAQQPLGLHTLGRAPERAHLASTVMQMLGAPLYERLAVIQTELARADYRGLQASRPYRFVDEQVLGDGPLDAIADPALRALAQRGRQHAQDLRAEAEIEGLLKGLAARWVEPSYGGDPIRNPDALPTGRNMYGFDPSRVPTPAAFEAGKQAVEQLIRRHAATHGGEMPRKLAFTMWSTETLRHLGMLEAQILYAMGVKPVWDAGGRVTGLQLIPLRELGRPRIDAVISLTGLYRDQFPNVIERLNEAVVMLAGLDESERDNPLRANTARIEAQLRQQGLDAKDAREFALTRVFGNESGDYGTGLTEATLASDQWQEGDGRLAQLYLSRMSWAYGPDSANWSRKYRDPQGRELNAYAEHLRGTSAAVFSRSSNLRGLLDTDHPFEYLGGISMAVRHLDGAAPQLYVSNLRDPAKARLETAEGFIAAELRSVYQHPNWMAEMKKESYAGTLELLKVVNNFWGWQVMDRGTVRDDQWQEFHDSYVRDRYRLGLREWFDKNNPTALAQLTERMLEAVRKDYWRADEQTQRELVALYQELAARHDVHTTNGTFKAYVQELAAGFGLVAPAAGGPPPGRTAAPRATTAGEVRPPPAAAPAPVQAPLVRGQQLREQVKRPVAQTLVWTYAALIGAVLVAGMVWQAWRTRRERRERPTASPLLTHRPPGAPA